MGGNEDAGKEFNYNSDERNPKLTLTFTCADSSEHVA